MNFTIRPARIEDLDPIYGFVCSLEDAVFDYEKFSLIYQNNIGHEDYHYLVAVSETGTVEGFISCHAQQLLHHCNKIAEIQELFVVESFRKSGAGGALVKEIKHIVATDCDTLEVAAQNKRIATHQFYEKIGFAQTHKKFVMQL